MAQDTEFVTFRVGQDNPRLITLADVNLLCATGHQPSHLGVLVIGREVKM